MTDEKLKEVAKRAAKAGYWLGKEARWNWPHVDITLDKEAEIIADAVLAEQPKTLEKRG